MMHVGAHDSVLVLLSVVIATAASYTALDLASRMRESVGWAHWTWLASASVAMGGGIWSMHFVAMLAFSLPGVETSYDLALTLVSLALPIAVTAFGFALARRSNDNPVAVVVSGLVMGLGIAGMHYTGMAAMRMPADLRHDGSWVAASILIAIGAAVAALWLASRRTGLAQRVAAAMAMGLAVSGMHYAAMQGAVFTPHAPIDHAHGEASVGQTYLALWVTGTTFLILVLALAAAIFDRHLASRAHQEALRLRDSEERFRLLLRAVTDYAIFMLDPNGRVANWNAGAERIKGYREAEALGLHVSTFYTEEDRRAGLPERALATATETGKFESEGWRLRKDGSRFWATVVVDVIRDERGVLRGFAKVTRDITEKKKAQEELDLAREALAQAQKMEAIGQLTGGVAHDFNNLLMVIQGSLDLLSRRLPTDERAERLLGNALKAAERGAALTQRMLAFARRQELKPGHVDLSDLIHGMMDLLKRSLGPAIHLETDIPADLPLALVDAHQLEMALLNLVVNSRDAMPKGGTIAIGVRAETRARQGERAAVPYLVLSVADSGDGMDPATLARAQEPFFTTKGVGKGTGLGLSMVHGLAEQSNGQLLLHSEKGRGTTAEIWLPAVTGDSTRRPPDPKAEPRGTPRGLRVLVVDDDVLVLKSIAAMLEELGHSVVEAESGEQAIAILEAGDRPDLVVSDHLMPGLSGLDLALTLERRGVRIPFLLATGFAELPPDGAGGYSKLTKPFSQAELAAAIEQVTSEPTSRDA